MSPTLENVSRSNSSSPTQEIEQTGRLWRWTVGRASSAIKVPVYTVIAALHLIKIVGKILANIVFLGQVSKFCNQTKTWNFAGIARDGISFMDKVQRTVNSAWCTVWAPSKNYRSLGEAASKSLKDLVEGTVYQAPELPNCWKFQWTVLKASIPNYFKQIIQCDSCANSFLKSIKNESRKCQDQNGETDLTNQVRQQAVEPKAG